MPENSNKLNLDDLLNLKRAEKPSSEFWEGFQKEFRQRQLQTLIEKESIWSRLPRALFARSSVLVPLSGAAVALFVLALNFQANSPLHHEYFETASLAPETPQPVSIDNPVEEVVQVDMEEASVFESSIPSPASFVVDVIPNKQPESLSYTREFPTSTIRSENRAVSALVSYTIAHDVSAFGMAGRHQTIGF